MTDWADTDAEAMIDVLRFSSRKDAAEVLAMKFRAVRSTGFVAGVREADAAVTKAFEGMGKPSGG